VHRWLHHWTTDDLIGFAHSAVDTLIVAYLIYHLIMLAKGTRAWQIISGLIVFVLIAWVSDWAQLTTLHWLSQQMLLLGPVAIVILFYPELRHALEEVGRVGFWGKNFTGLQREDVTHMIDEIVRAASFLSDKRIGALVVLERETGLTDIIDTGTTVNGSVTAELIETLFFPGSPLHDGAVVVRRARIVAAGCTLPLSESRNIGGTVHTRHKAAIGMSEQSDALVIVVSEESGIVSLAFGGRLVRGIRDDTLRDRLIDEYTGRERPTRRRRTPVGSAASSGVRALTHIAPFLSPRSDRNGRSAAVAAPITTDDQTSDQPLDDAQAPDPAADMSRSEPRSTPT